MRCEKVVAQLSAFLDGELAPREAERIRAHIESCPDCRRERRTLERTARLVRDLPQTAAPEDLHDRVMAKINAAPVIAAVPRSGFSRRVLWPAAAAVVLACLIGLLSPTLLRSRARQPSKQVDSDIAEKSFALKDKEADELVLGKAAAPPPVLKSATESAVAKKGGGTPDRRAGEAMERLKETTGALGFERKRSVTPPVSVEVINIAAPSQRAAFSQTVGFASFNGWIAPEEVDRALAANRKPGKPVSQIILFLNDAETARLRAEFARTGLQEVLAWRGKRADVAGTMFDAAHEREAPQTAKGAAPAAEAPGRETMRLPAKAKAEEARDEGEAATRQEPTQTQSLKVRLLNRALLPGVQSVRTQNAILEEVRNSGEPLKQVTVNILSLAEAAKQTEGR